jgi:anti-sigma factor RsiW
VDLEILSLYQDGSLDAGRMKQVDEHLLECEACQEQFRELGRAGLFLQIGMASRKHAECLSEEELGAYLSGRMSRRDRSRIEGHLLICRRCLKEVSDVADPELFEASNDSPAPDAAALARFALLAQGAQRPASRTVLRWSLSTAAAALLAVAVGLSYSYLAGSPGPTMAPVAEPVVEAGRANVTSSSAPESTPERLELISDPTVLQPDSTDMAAFAREIGVILAGVQNLGRNPDVQMLEILKEDVLHSGLVNALARLTENTRDLEERKFLIDCRDVLMRLVQLDRKDFRQELPLLLKDVRDMNLIETARLMELERGTAPWLALR